MSLLDSLIHYLKENPSYDKEKAPSGYCPNCWGTQEYGGKFYQAVKNFKNDVDSHDPKDGWVKEYADKHLLHIRLHKKDDDLVCKNCQFEFIPEDE